MEAVAVDAATDAAAVDEATVDAASAGSSILMRLPSMHPLLLMLLLSPPLQSKSQRQVR